MLFEQRNMYLSLYFADVLIGEPSVVDFHCQESQFVVDVGSGVNKRS